MVYRYLFILYLILVGISLLGVVLAKVPEPGSKEDPLVTKTYVDWYAKWQELNLKAGDFLKLEMGTEFLLVEPSDHPLHLREVNLDATRIVDVTSGTVLTSRDLSPYHLYLVASVNEARIVIDDSAKIFIRGLKP